MKTNQAAIKLAVVHAQIRKHYKANYKEVITPYINIINQVMEANSIDEYAALDKINQSGLVQTKPTENKEKDLQNLAIAAEKQKLFISAALCITEANAPA